MPAKNNGNEPARQRTKQADSFGETDDDVSFADDVPFTDTHSTPTQVSHASAAATSDPGASSVVPKTVAQRVMEQFSATADEPGVGGAFVSPLDAVGAVGFTHFDSPASEDGAITVLVPKELMSRLPAQTLVRIRSRQQDDTPASPADTTGSLGSHDYLGVVVAGPFAEPDGLRADSSLVIATTVSGNGQVLMPRYHGRAMVEILGEIEAPSESGKSENASKPDSDDNPSEDDRVARSMRPPPPRVLPPQHRPLPNSPVFPLNDAETALFLRAGGTSPADARIGLMVGRDRVAVTLPTDRKHVLPRHTGVLGTTGGGKSTTVAGLIHRLQAAGVATVIIDVEGEYTEIDQPTDDPNMLAALRQRGMSPAGVPDLHVLHPVGRQTSRQSNARRVHPFSLKFSELSPHAVTELLEMPEAQQERFLKCFDATRQILRDLRVFPANREEEDQLPQLDELETGYPRMTLSHLIDVAGLFAHAIAKDEADAPLYNEVLAAHASQVKQRVAQHKSSHEFSWRGLIGRLHRVNRLRIFDNPAAAPLRYAGFLEPGRVSVIDLSDTDEPQVRNLVIADVLRGIQREQEKKVEAALADHRAPTPVVVVIEEAHEFLSAQRIRQMPTLFQQVARIARRGRKRWLGLMFVTQLPQHLPDEALGLINNWFIHKISDAGVIDRLRKSISGLDRSQWNRVPGLAPGQAVVSLTSLARPLVVSVDPAPCRLRLVE
jgi:hypothetical protein